MFNMDTNMQGSDRVAVIGAGLVGASCACTLARHGFKVDLFELREDLRNTSDISVGRSINLALSVRGQQSLKLIGLEEEVINKHAIPMNGRMIHDLDGSTHDIPYGKKGQCIYSVSRRSLLELLLNCAEKNPNVQLFFKHKLLSANFSRTEVVMEKDGKEKVSFSGYRAIIGCDGAFSRVRQSILKSCRFNYEQKYIDHGYIEMSIEPKDGNFAMGVNYLHIWPRGEFMMIALPNNTRTYTVTLFMPFERFEALKTSQDIIGFFNKYFPDSVALIGETSLVSTFQTVPPGALMSIKCSPYHVEGGNGLLLGDAAHAMVPFYGQGMNCGFEDVLILDGLFRKFGTSNLQKTFSEFSAVREQDAKAIVDLALYNYIEMRDLVNQRSFKLRKMLDNFLHYLFPRSWVPLYTSVTFTRTPYAQCVKNKEWQDKAIKRSVRTLRLIGVAVVIRYGINWMRKSVNLGEIFAKIL